MSLWRSVGPFASLLVLFVFPFVAEGQTQVRPGNPINASGLFRQPDADVSESAKLRLAWTSRMNEGAHFESTGERQKAIVTFRESVSIAEAMRDHNTDLAESLLMLGQALAEDLSFQEAETYLRRSMIVQEAAPARYHDSYVDAINLLAYVLAQENQSKECEKILRKSLAVQESYRGSSHEDLIFPLKSLAILLEYTGKKSEAEVHIGRALAIAEKKYGPDSKEVVELLQEHSRICRKLGHLRDSAKLERRAVNIRLKHALRLASRSEAGR